MLSPTPLSLLCALLLCLPLAIVFTVITPPNTTPTTSAAENGAAAMIPPIPITTTTATTRISTNPVTITTTSGGATTVPTRITTTTAALASTSGAAMEVSTPTTTTSGGASTVPTHKSCENPETTTSVGGGAAVPTAITTTTGKKSVNPLITVRPIVGDQGKSENITTTIANPPPQSPPPSAAEDGEDPLLRRAARSNPNPKPPRKLAFLFLTSTPLPFAPLWEIFFNQTPTTLYNIYIHADPRFPYDPPFSGVFQNRVIPGAKPTRRYSPTLIAAARRLLSHALLHDPSNSMFALLSPSCIPLHSFNYTHKFLVASKKSFIEILENEPGAYHRWAARGEDVMLPELPFEEFRIGSQFFVLTRKHARLVVRDKRLWSKFKLQCLHKYTCYPEEHYFPTLISMKDPRGCVHATLTHVDWRGRHDGHPRTYNASEVGPDLIMALRSERPRYGDDVINGSDSFVTERHDPFLFARKFSPASIQPLLRIANDVIFRD